jgi:hypothetical protein
MSLVNDGAISGVQVFGSSVNALINNAGSISPESGTVAIAFANGSGGGVINSGTVHGYMTVDPTSTVQVDNSGMWHGGLQFASSGDDVFNTGTIVYGLEFGSTELTVTNEYINNDGTIKNGIILNSTAYSTLDNSSTIDGGVLMGTGSNFDNSGTIHGNVAEGTLRSESGGTWINTGTIEGNVSFNSLSTGSYTFDNSAGVVTGSVTAGGGADTFDIGTGNNTYYAGTGKDTFDFGVNFGHDVIYNFVNGTPNHDIIGISLQDFANIAAVEAAMTQVGTNTAVVITDSAGGTITIEHTTIATLEAHTNIFLLS